MTYIKLVDIDFLILKSDTFWPSFTRLLDLVNVDSGSNASALSVELHESIGDSKFYVRVKCTTNANNQDQVPVKALNCDDLCPLETFMELVQDRVVNDFNLSCQDLIGNFISSSLHQISSRKSIVSQKRITEFKE
jgi:hypothetical protein